MLQQNDLKKLCAEGKKAIREAVIEIMRQKRKDQELGSSAAKKPAIKRIRKMCKKL